ncbi:MAG: hypothetical protein U9Q79_11640, partial [Candidatus Hydrogenedentes bacterium]|nr:hypothetical protein [Candidatus Hydrogenedentota bacterium]
AIGAPLGSGPDARDSRDVFRAASAKETRKAAIPAAVVDRRAGKPALLSYPPTMDRLVDELYALTEEEIQLVEAPSPFAGPA